MPVKAVKFNPDAAALDSKTLKQMIARTAIATYKACSHAKDCGAELKRLLKINDEHGGE